MLDLKFVRSNPGVVEADLKKRGDAEKLKWFKELLSLDKKGRELQVEGDELRARRNKISIEISEAKKKGKDAKHLLKEAAEIPVKIKEAEEEFVRVQEKIRYYLMRLPNVLDASVPVGEGEEDNEVVRTVGKKPAFSFTPKSHVDLIQELDLADLERAAKVSGARFFFLKNELVQMELAVMKMALDLLVKKGFVPVIPPYMIRREPYEGVTDLADFESVLYKAEGEDLYLIATSEHPIAAMHSDEILEPDQLPLKYAGVSPCFRKEAGAHGKDTKGIFRVHQFTKIEQFIFCKPEESRKFHEELLKNAEELMKLLEIPYRVVNICTSEIGIVAAKKYDVEAWYPSQNAYREVVSCSNCTSYQATRLNIRYRLKKGGEGKDWVHTLNSTEVASPRILVAILENFQQKDGSIKIPRALQPHLNGLKEIVPKK